MSLAPKQQQKATTLHTFSRKKQSREKISAITCYDYTTAKILDQTDIDCVLVGDSLAMTVLGHPNTLSVTVDEMLHHTKAVSRGCKRAFVIADMPFMSYHINLADSMRNAGRFIQEGGCSAVKIEGASEENLTLIRRLVSSGIPVMGHLGFTPQAIHALGGYKVQGKTITIAKQLLSEAQALEAAGAFAIVLEMVPVQVAAIITQMLTVPTIGIGSGNLCDGQILVIDDLLGRYQDLTPRFVRQYAQQANDIQQAITAYHQDIKQGTFPDNQAEAFGFEEDLLTELHMALLELPDPRN